MDAAEDFSDFDYLLAPIKGYLDRLWAKSRRSPVTYRSATAPDQYNQYCHSAGKRVATLEKRGWRFMHLPAAPLAGDVAGLNWDVGGWAVIMPGDEVAPPMRFPAWVAAVEWAEAMDRALFAPVSATRP